MKHTALLLILLLLANYAFSASGISSVTSSMDELCSSLQSTLPLIAMLMVFFAVAVYAIGQMMGAETRSKANIWAAAAMVGALVSIIIVVVSPPVLSAVNGSTVVCKASNAPVFIAQCSEANRCGTAACCNSDTERCSNGACVPRTPSRNISLNAICSSKDGCLCRCNNGYGGITTHICDLNRVCVCVSGNAECADCPAGGIKCGTAPANVCCNGANESCNPYSLTCQALAPSTTIQNGNICTAENGCTCSCGDNGTISCGNGWMCSCSPTKQCLNYALTNKIVYQQQCNADHCVCSCGSGNSKTEALCGRTQACSCSPATCVAGCPSGKTLYGSTCCNDANETYDGSACVLKVLPTIGAGEACEDSGGCICTCGTGGVETCSNAKVCMCNPARCEDNCPDGQPPCGSCCDLTTHFCTSSNTCRLKGCSENEIACGANDCCNNATQWCKNETICMPKVNGTGGYTGDGGPSSNGGGSNPPPSCPVGQAYCNGSVCCSVDQDCINNTCMAPPPACGGAANGNCSNSKEACVPNSYCPAGDYYCTTIIPIINCTPPPGIPARVPCTCCDVGQPCSSADTCCYGNTCEQGVCVASCKSDGGNCASSSECCSGLICGQMGTCHNANCAGMYEQCGATPCCSGLACYGMCFPSGGCFLPGTHVQTPRGELPIEGIVAGDIVYSFAENGTVSASIVSAKYVAERESYYTVRADGYEVNATAEHPFLTPSGYRQASDLAAGDSVFIYQNGILSEKAVTSVSRINAPATVYNLQVDGDHTFFANGFAVHNKRT